VKTWFLVASCLAGLVYLTAPGCGAQCKDRFDNDGDGLSDTYLDGNGGDPGCSNPADDKERTGVVGTLSDYTGPCQITANGTTIVGKLLSAACSSLTIDADGVTVRNSKIVSDAPYPIRIRAASSGVLIENSEIDGADGDDADDEPADVCIKDDADDAYGGGYNTITGNDIHDCDDGISAGDGALVSENWIHDPQSSTGSHTDGIEVYSAGDVKLVRNVIEGDFDSMAVNITAESRWGGVGLVFVSGNYLDHLGGGYASLVDGDAEMIVDRVIFAHNRYGPHSHAGYGNFTLDDAVTVSCTMTGNKLWNGTTLVDLPGWDDSFTCYVPACADGHDDDGDFTVDYPADAGCTEAAGNLE